VRQDKIDYKRKKKYRKTSIVDTTCRFTYMHQTQTIRTMDGQLDGEQINYDQENEDDQKSKSH